MTGPSIVHPLRKTKPGYSRLKRASARAARLVVVVLASVCAAACAAGANIDQTKDVAVSVDALYAIGGPYWSLRPIPVCWGQPTNSADVPFATVAQTAEQGSWASVSDLQLAGWQQCTSDTVPGIHILTENNVTRFESPYVQCDADQSGAISVDENAKCVLVKHSGGCDLDNDGTVSVGVAGVPLFGLDANGDGTLQFSEVRERNCADDYGWPRADLGQNANKIAVVHLSFNYLAQQDSFGGCRTTPGAAQDCVRQDATHEFGHALGYQHEQDRDDNGGACTDGVSAAPVGPTIGPWDKPSTMDYCAMPRANDGALSFWDIIGHQNFYGAKFVTFSGATTFDPAVGSNADGRMEVFASDANNRLVHSWQSLNGPFAAWVDFAFVTASAPTVAQNTDGRLEVFAISTDGALWHSQQQSVNGPFAPMTSLGGTLIHAPPAVGQNADGRLEVFVVGADSHLYHKWQTSPGGAWVDAYAVEATSFGFEDSPVVGTNVDGRMEVFALATDHAIVHGWQTAVNAALAPFESLGGSFKGRPAVARNADGRMELFAIGSDSVMQHRWQTAPNAYFAAWAPMGSRPFAGDTPVIFSDSDGTLEILATSSDLGLVRAWQIDSNGAFTDFFSMRGAPVEGFSREVRGTPAVGRNADGRREFFARSVVGPNLGPVLHNWQRSSARAKEVSGDVMQGLIWE